MSNFPDLKKPSHFFATFFGIGLLPFAPGTWGSFAGLVLFLFLIYFEISFNLYLLLILFIIGFAIITCSQAVKKLDDKDHKSIVIDEVAGIGISFIFIPFLGFYDFDLSEWGDNVYLAAIILFVLFRFFDILKPHPISYFDKNLKSGFGVVFDDLIAGVFAGLTLLGGNFFINLF